MTKHLGKKQRAEHLLRPARFDDLGLRRALSDRLLPLLVAAMVFLAALSLAGVVGASGLARHWQMGAGGLLTVQVPNPAAASGGGGSSRAEQALEALRATPGIADARRLSDDELADLLRPWLGSGAGRIAIPLPAVLEARVTGTGPDHATLVAALEHAAPGTVVEENDRWVRRMANLARSLQACAGLMIAVVGFVLVAVVAVATRAGLAARRDAIDTVHGLGAPDGYIAARFAARVTLLAGAGGAIGAAVALPLLVGLAALAAPFAGTDIPTSASGVLGAVPLGLWLCLPALPLLAAAIGWLTAQATVRRWLSRLP